MLVTRQKNILLYISLFLISIIFISDAILFDKYPVTSADPAIKYWSAVYNSEQIKQGNFPLWNSNAGVGQNIFSKSILHSPFSAAAIFLSFFEDSAIGFTIYIWIQIFLFSLFIGIIIRKIFSLSFASVFTIVILSLFSTSSLNEYIFNGFSGYLFFPLMLFWFLKAEKGKGDTYSAIGLGVTLALAHLFSNVSVVQFSLIFFGFYTLYLWWDYKSPVKCLLRTFRYLAITTVVWFCIMAFFTVPFLYEVFAGERSHIYSLTGGFSFFMLVKYLFLPFTSWVFIDEKMITTGLLTQLESLNGFVSLLLFPSLIVFILNRRVFNPAERFFFYYVICFLFIGWLNQYIPILGYIVKITKATGWWRSYPIFIFSSAIAIGLVITRLSSGKLAFSNSRIRMLLQKFMVSLSVIYAVASIAIIVLICLYYYAPDLFLKMLSQVSVRPVTDLLGYVEEYYFAEPVIYALVAIPAALAVMLWMWRYMLMTGRNTSKVKSSVFVVALLLAHYVMIHIYYPMNTGIKQNLEIPEMRYLQDLPSDNRIAIIFNKQSDIENVEGDGLNLESAKRLRSYPEFTRFQSNINMQGISWIANGSPGVYTMGSNFVPPYLNDFHLSVLEKDPDIREIFVRKKGYFRLGANSAESRLLDIAGVTHFLSSLPLLNTRYVESLVGKQFTIYENKSAFPKIFIAHEYELINNEKIYKPAETVDSFSVQHQENDFILIDLNMLEKSLLVINDLYHNGWNAYLDGKFINIKRVNFMFKGIEIPEGVHQLELHFSPPGYKMGVIVSLLSVLLLLGFLIIYFLKLQRERLF